MRKALFFLFLSSFLFRSPAESASVAAPVLLELFTSQGCSSCPPAERLLNTWGMGLFQAHKALPLAFHVDYWDYLGWKDAFSDLVYSDRQRDYAAFFDSNSIYTPQLVVQGQNGFNGADAERAQREVAGAQTLPGPALRLSVIGSKAHIQVPAALAEHLTDHTSLHLAVFENGLQTMVQRGENGGATLAEDFVVRQFQTLTYGDLKAKGPELSFQTPGNPAKTGVAVWFQDPRTRQVFGLEWIYPLKKN